MSSVSYLFVDLNSYFASVEQEIHPKLRAKPVAVIPTNSDYTSCIAASYEAKAYGIKTGTLVKEAKRLCPQITFRLAKHKAYVDYHHKIMTAIESCHPIHQIMSIDECVLKLGGRDQQIKEALKLANEIRGSIFNVGSQLKCSIGISINRFLAKLASNLQKPNGLSLITKEDLPHKLYHLKLNDFPGIGSSMLKRLHAHGITTTQDLYQQDMYSLRKIWGSVMGERFYLYLNGKEVADIPLSATKSIAHSHVLPPQYRSHEGSYQIALRLLEKAAMRLRKLPAWTRGLKISLRFTDGSRWKSQLKIHETQDSLSLIQNLNYLWQKRPYKIPKKVAITFYDLLHLQEKNHSIFDQPKLENLSYAVDKINDKFGKNIVHSAASKSAQKQAHNRIAFHQIPDNDFEDN